MFSPGIEANWGDWIEVEVHNNLKEGTSLHWFASTNAFCT